jgi:hypothetical protein
MTAVILSTVGVVTFLGALSAQRWARPGKASKGLPTYCRCPRCNQTLRCWPNRGDRRAMCPSCLRSFQFPIARAG